MNGGYCYGETYNEGDNKTIEIEKGLSLDYRKRTVFCYSERPEKCVGGNP